MRFTLRQHSCRSLGFTIALLLLAAASAEAFEPRRGYSKVVGRFLFSQPNASAPAAVVLQSGGEVLDTYENSVLGYVPNEFLDRLLANAATARVEMAVRDEFDTIQFPDGVIDTRRGIAESFPGRTASPPYHPYERGLYVVQFIGPIAGEWQDALRALGISIIQYLPYNALIVAGSPPQLAAVRPLRFVQFVEIMHTFLKPQAVPRSRGIAVNLVVQIAATEGWEDIAAETGRLSLTPSRQSRPLPEEVRIEGQFDAGDVDHLLTLPLVFGVAHVPAAELSDERVGLSLTRHSTANTVSNATGYETWLSSVCSFCTSLMDHRFWIGFADTGLDSGTTTGDHHPDLPVARIKYGSNFESPGSALNDIEGHGTVVAGIAGGNRTSSTDSGGFYWGQGIVPSVGLFVTKINVGAGLTSIFTSAGDAATQTPPVYVQNHSYNQYYITAPSNTCFGGSYSLLSRDFDIAVKDANGTAAGGVPMTLTVSAGNQHTDLNACAANLLRRLTLPPATAKNVIAVGESENVRPSSEGWKCRFCGFANFNNIAANSKRGTGSAGWFKPDLFAPAANVTIPLSPVARKPNTSGGYTNDPLDANSFCEAASQADGGIAPTSPPIPSGYGAGEGTSFAAPVAAAAATLARRLYAERVSPGCTMACDPGAASPALTKAMVIASARSMRGGTAYNRVTTETQTIGAIPNDLQGFGRIHLEDMFPIYPHRYYFNEGHEFTSAASPPSWTKTLTVHDATLPVKVVLVWTDRPALENDTNQTSSTLTPLVNDLDLSVEPGTACSSTRYVGNSIDSVTEQSQSVSCTDPTRFDRKNNVELVTFTPAAGVTQFVIRVSVASGQIDSTNNKQSFAVVAYNAYEPGTSDAPRAVPQNLVATGSGSTVTVTWNASSDANGATKYEVQRRAAGGSFTTLGTVTATAYTDASVTTGNVYAYRVRAVTTTSASAWSVSDIASLITFTDDPLQVGTLAKVQHLMELRSAVNQVRAVAGLGNATFTDDPPTAGSTMIKPAYIQELREALGSARAALNASTLSFTDPQLTSLTTVIKALHFTQLREGVR